MKLIWLKRLSDSSRNQLEFDKFLYWVTLKRVKSKYHWWESGRGGAQNIVYLLKSQRLVSLTLLEKTLRILRRSMITVSSYLNPYLLKNSKLHTRGLKACKIRLKYLDNYSQRAIELSSLEVMSQGFGVEGSQSSPVISSPCPSSKLFIGSWIKGFVEGVKNFEPSWRKES